MVQEHGEFYEWFWDESIWLPKITSWEHIKANRLAVTENLGGLYLCVPVAIGMMMLRFAFERSVLFHNCFSLKFMIMKYPQGFS